MKGQVELVIVATLLAFLLFIPMIYTFGIQPKSELETQASDIEPFMKTSHIAMYIDRAYKVSAARASVNNATSGYLGTSEEFMRGEALLNAVEGQAAKSYEEKIGEIVSEKGCTVTTNPDISVDMDLNSSEVCGVSASFENGGEPLTIKCTGESSSFEKEVRTGLDADIEDIRIYWMRKVLSEIMDDEKISEGDFEAVDEKYEDYGSGDCFDGVDVNTGDTEDGEVWINVSYPGKTVMSSKGVLNQSVNLKYGPD